VRRRQLVATATAGAIAALLAMSSVEAAPLLSPRHVPGVAPIGLNAALQPAPPVRTPRRTPLIIAHRGASAYRAENTLDAYRLAITMGADYIEADLVMTRDGQLVARHENDLSSTTDVARHTEFANRRRTKPVLGAPSTGWFTEDFTLAELKTLHAQARRLPGGKTSAIVPAGETVPSLQEIIDIAHSQSVARGRPVGLYLELKFPAYFASIGLAPEPALIAALRRNDLARRTSPVFVESFEAASLRTVHNAIEVPLILLLWGDGGAGDPSGHAADLAEASTYVTGIGIDRSRIRTLVCPPPQHLGAPQPSLSTGQPPADNVIALAHSDGLEVHVFTFSNSTVSGPFRSTAYRPGDPPALADQLAEYRAYYGLGVDGVFTDNPDTARQARPTALSR
jgi:glycerophosphoryl diester phosphodiesterase